jgi:hypothetical protein
VERPLAWTSQRIDQHHRSQKQALSTRDRSLQVSSEDSTIEETFQLLLSTDLRTRFTGKLKFSNSTTIITFQSSSRASEKSKIHIDSSQCRVSLICLRREELRFSQLFLSLSSPLRVNIHIPNSLSSCFEHQRRWNYLHHLEDLTSSRNLLWHHWRSSSALL